MFRAFHAKEMKEKKFTIKIYIIHQELNLTEGLQKRIGTDQKRLRSTKIVNENTSCVTDLFLCCSVVKFIISVFKNV